MLKIKFIVFSTVLIFLSQRTFADDLKKSAKIDGESKTQTYEKKTAKEKSKVKKNKSTKSKTRKRKKRKRCRAWSTKQYKKMVRNWRKKPKIPKPRYRYGYRDLTLYSVNHGERIRVFPFLADGTLDPEVMEKISHIFRDKDSENKIPVDERLVKLIYKTAALFRALQINIISGYRDGVERGSESNHTKGRAIDFMVPGKNLLVVTRRIRRFGHVGVGYYPTSGFIHLDVRNGPSYFWIDRSGPGHSSCLNRILTKTGMKFDRKYKPKYDEPIVHVNAKKEPLNTVKHIKKLRKIRAKGLRKNNAGELK